MPRLRQIRRVLLIPLLLLGLYGYFKYKNQPYFQPKLTSNQDQSASIPNTATVEDYYSVYQNPFVIYLRIAFAAYSKGVPQVANIDSAAIQASKVENIESGLDNFDKNYYQSKFVVLTISDNERDGKDLQIIFQDKPDRIFYAWIVKDQSSEVGHSLIGFNSRTDITKETMDDLVETYKEQIQDKEHSI